MSDKAEPTNPMSLDEYQTRAKATDCYPPDTRLLALVLGLASEAGEVAGKLSKHLRGDNPSRESEIALKRALASELWDVLWYVAMTADALGIKLSDGAQANLAKLEDRQARDMIKGDGDDR